LPDQKLIAKRQKTADMISISSRGFAGGIISDAVDRGTPGYRREWQEFFKSRIIDMAWI